jgi:hypothetical protein
VKIKFRGGEKHIFATHQKGAKASNQVIRTLLFVFEYCEKAASFVQQKILLIVLRSGHRCSIIKIRNK